MHMLALILGIDRCRLFHFLCRDRIHQEQRLSVKNKISEIQGYETNEGWREGGNLSTLETSILFSITFKPSAIARTPLDLLILVRQDSGQ